MYSITCTADLFRISEDDRKTPREIYFVVAGVGRLAGLLSCSALTNNRSRDEEEALRAGKVQQPC